MNRKMMYGFILASLVMAIVVNYYSPLESFWTLFLIPAIAILVLFPQWKTTIAVGLSGFILMAITEFTSQYQPFPRQDAVHLTIAGAVEWFVYAVISFFLIQTARLIAKLERLAITDPLTKIHNRRYLDLQINAAPLCHGSEQSTTLILFDIDHFKAINDTYGHDAGDTVLKKLAVVVRGIIRNSDIFVRIGGEEFMIILPNCPLDQGIKLAERIRETIERTAFIYNEKPILVTISMGITEYTGGQDISRFIEKADEALYQAKETGRNKVVIL